VAIERRIDVSSSKEKIEIIRNDYPNLTRWGFWPNAQDSFEAARAEMTSNGAIEEFERASRFLTQHCERRQSCSKYSSYGWKHRAESWFREQTGYREYVSNGMFIAAAIANSFKIGYFPGSPNCRISISAKSWNVVAPAKRDAREGRLRVLENHDA
jgi:hypothetical protein